MTGNLTLHNDTPLGDEAYAAAQRQTAIGLAGVALDAAAGGEEQAKAMLHDPLEAIGLLPYQPGTGKYHWGQQP